MTASRLSLSHTSTLHLSLSSTLHLSPQATESTQLTSFKVCLTVSRVLVEALLLVDDDVLDVLHGQVVSEGVEQDVFQLLKGDTLHVKLQGGGKGSKRVVREKF